MVTKKSWEEFRASGLLWFINTILHTFGWAICCDIEEDKITVKDAYPARVKFRGFDGECNDEGYTKVTNFLRDNIAELKKECED
jgi:hypothetical protein